MSVELSLNTGASAYADSENTLSDLVFGARYTSYRDIDRFLEQTDDANLGLIVWPGGTLAETRDDLYGFGFDELYNPDSGKPGLSEMMAIAVDQGTGLSVILPTARYDDDPEAVRADIHDFMGELLGGAFGPLPEPMILEIGSEYYGNFSDGATTAAAQYGAVADIMVAEISLALADPSVNLVGADVAIAVQAGKTLEDDADIRAELSETVIANTDMLIHHRFAYQPQGIDGRIDDLQLILESWATDGGDAPDLFVSAWNTVTLTRNEMLDDYIRWEADRGNDVQRSDVDLEGRTTTEFETYWQDRLDDAAYGQEHAAYILESFHSYAEAGMDAASLYGVDLVHPGRVSWEQDGVAYDFVGAEMLEMIYESVGGTHVIASEADYDPQAPVTSYAFENEDKLVVFLAAGNAAPGEVTLDLEGLGLTYEQVWVERLTGETPEDWMAIFGIADNPDVDESPEAETYTVGIREVVQPELDNGGLTVSLDSPHEVIRLAFAKTDAGAAEISSWAEGTGVDLSDVPFLPPVDPKPMPQDEDDELSDDLALLAEAAGGGGGFGLLFALLFLL